AVAWGTAPVVIEDTNLLPVQRQVIQPWDGPITSPGEINAPRKPLDVRPKLEIGADSGLVAGSLDPAGRRPLTTTMFPGIGQTAWTPPDPTLGVGPNHVLSTVNMSIAWWTKAGSLQFSSNLDSTGNPGFFETVGAGTFTFDPKCFYDHYAGRWVVIAPEVYGSTEAWICIAVSDDNNPNGTWYKYRTDAVITVGNNTYWWDYPGFGYDQNAYYVSGNLFGLNNSGWGGVGYRVFHKAPLLNGQPAVFSTLRDSGAASVQVAQAHGNPSAPYFVSVNNNSSMKIQAITNPLTSPAIATTTVSVPGFQGPGSAPAAGGQSVSLIDSRIMNAHWRGGNLYATHHISASGVNVARWYHFNTNNWPTSGGVSLAQSGNINPGGGKHTYFPAIYSNKFHDVGIVVGESSSDQRIGVSVAGRRVTDPPGTMGPLTQLHLSPVNGGGRWGDYQDIT
nr:hypothetical protein [Phycisphaerales bacterium]